MNDKISNTGTQTVYLRGPFGETIKLEPGQSIDPPASTLQSVADAVDVALPPMPEPEGGKLRYDHTGSLLPEPSFSADQVRAYAIQAVMAERERCAAICREHCEDALGVPFKNYEDTHHDGYQDAANDIESAIRAQPEPKT